MGGQSRIGLQKKDEVHGMNMYTDRCRLAPDSCEKHGHESRDHSTGFSGSSEVPSPGTTSTELLSCTRPVETSTEGPGTNTGTPTSEEALGASRLSTGSDAGTLAMSTAGRLRSGFSSDIWIKMFFLRPIRYLVSIFVTEQLH